MPNTMPNIAIFNGMGTKGTSIAPYWAWEMVGFLIGGKIISREVDLGRFGIGAAIR